MSEAVLHQAVFVTDHVAVRALLRVPAATAQALANDLRHHAALANDPTAEKRIKGVAVYAHPAEDMPACSNDPAWGAYALLQGVSGATYDLDLDAPKPLEQPYGLHDFKQEAQELDARAAQCAPCAAWDTWSFSFVRDRGGDDDCVGEVVMRLPEALRDEAEGWLGELRGWMEDTQLSYDGAIERLEALPVATTLKETVTHCQEILRTHAHGDHPWLTALADHLAVVTAEVRASSAQHAPPVRRRALRRA